jgi:membrane protease YdiL (CAAX protease family)
MKQKCISFIENILNLTGLNLSQGMSQDIRKQREPIIILIFITTIMLLLEYFGWQRPFLRIIAPKFSLLPIKTNAHSRLLYAQGYTTFAFWILFILAPTLVLKLMDISFGKLKKRGLEGLSRPRREHLRPYLIIAAFMFTCLLVVCASPSFYRFYPLFRPHNYTEWISFELIYLAQFVAVEYFFRGPLLFRLNHHFESSSIAIMTLPYALIHIHKPFPEAIGSVIAGLVLGHLSLKSKSIWPGVALHIFIAFCADSLGLFYGGDFTRW